MVYRVIITEPADLDLDRISDYIANHLHNKTAAANLRKEYRENLSYLPENPKIFEKVNDDTLAAKGYRRFSFGGYVAVHRVDDEAKCVYVVKIFHQRQDYLQLL
jgi:plasmid stabilization system protein ParE